jgi:hypothetical protein
MLEAAEMRKVRVPSSKGRKRRSSMRRINLIEQAEEIERIFQKAVQHELLIHKNLGNPIATWRHGKVVVIPPEQIDVGGTI